jgi:riboflavin-specific deaminase-like protein
VTEDPVIDTSFANATFPGSVFPETAWAALWAQPERSRPPGDRPVITGMMVSSLDGHVTEDGRVSSLTGPPDQALLHQLRAVHDGVLVGASTVRIEGYDALLTPEEQAQRKERTGTAQPVLCIVSASARLESSLAVFTAKDLEVAVLTKKESSTEQLPRDVEVIGGESDASGALDLHPLLRELKAKNGIDRLLCEGGPTLLGSLVRARLLDELVMVISPRISGGDGPRAILEGGPHPRAISLIAHAVVDEFVFLRYGLPGEAAT